MLDSELQEWFVTEVLPLERGIAAYLGRNSYQGDEAEDLLHDIYERAVVGARRARPLQTRAYLFTIARNLLITRAKRAKIVQFQLISDSPEEIDRAWEHFDHLSPERHVSARQELDRFMQAMDRLPAKCRHVVRLRKIEGFAIAEIAAQLGVSNSAIEQHLTFGMKSIADYLHGGSGQVRRKRDAPEQTLLKKTENDC